MEQKKHCESALEIEYVVPILSKITIFSGLADKQLVLLFPHLTQACYSKDEYIFRQGGEAGSIYIIESGSVKIVLDSEGESFELSRLSVGQCFGETSVIGIQSHSASAVAVEDTQLISLSRKALFTIFEQDKELFSLLILNIAREACRRLHKTDEVFLHYMAGNRKEKHF